MRKNEIYPSTYYKALDPTHRTRDILSPMSCGGDLTAAPKPHFAGGPSAARARGDGTDDDTEEGSGVMGPETNYVPIDKRIGAILSANGFTLSHISFGKKKWRGPPTTANIDPEDLRDGILIVQLPDGTLRLTIDTWNGSICVDIVNLREGSIDLLSYLRGLKAGPPGSGEQTGT